VHEPQLIVETVAGPELCVRLVGELDMGTTSELEAALAGLGPGDLVIDCKKLTFLDSMGIHALVQTSAERRERGYRVRL